MEIEEDILKRYITGNMTGEDNKLQAVIGSLNSKSSKELSSAINALKSEISHSSYNFMINNTSNADNLNQGISQQVSSLNAGIARQVENIINSNEAVSKSNEKNAEKTHRFTKWNIGLTVVLAITSVISLINIYFTNSIKNESIRANQINEQPVLTFVDIDSKPYKFVNSGKGVALNMFLIIWDKSGKQLYVTPENSVLEAMGVNMTGQINANELVKSNIEDVKNKIPATSKLFAVAEKKDTAWFALIYEDIYGKKFVTLVRGPGGDYTKAVEFVDLNRN